MVSIGEGLLGGVGLDTGGAGLVTGGAGLVVGGAVSVVDEVELEWPPVVPQLTKRSVERKRDKWRYFIGINCVTTLHKRVAII